MGSSIVHDEHVSSREDGFDEYEKIAQFDGESDG
jgi:hypothetical protein